ncbi:MAG: adenylate/guanylate cyclase domain-containing protein [Clostridiales bacterium]|nr:adenylate/guanylate cyclase domain-containing protein [Clostridiales bacterium]
MSDTITKTEYDIAKNAIENILSEPVEKITIQDTIPTSDDLSDNNQVFRGKLSILFVDMRKSSELTEDEGNKTMVKIYRAFTRIVIQAIRYSGGYSRQFAGDGIMGVFQDITDEETDIKTMSSSMAIKAARYIITLVDKCLNPLLEKHLRGISITCSVGVCTGNILITKTGMKGKEGDASSENETGIVWVGKTTNNASRYCALANGGEIFIDNQTFDESIYR